MLTKHGGKCFQELSRILWSVEDRWEPGNVAAIVTAGALQEIRDLLKPISELARKQLDREQEKLGLLNRRAWILVNEWAEPLHSGLRRMCGQDARLAASALLHVKFHVRHHFDSSRFPLTQAGYAKFRRWIKLLHPESVEILRVKGVGVQKAAAWRKLLEVYTHAQTATD